MDKLIGKRMRGEDKKPRCITGHKWWPKLSIEERFWPKVDKCGDDECWPWMGALFMNGYGAFSPKASVTFRAHKLAYELTHGVVPEGLLLRHTCDNPSCCNPNHLLTGTHKDNAKDRMERGRCKKTSRKGWHMLKPEDVRCIRELREEGMPRIHLAQWFGITEHAISGIHHRRTYKHVA